MLNYGSFGFKFATKALSTEQENPRVPPWTLIFRAEREIQENKHRKCFKESKLSNTAHCKSLYCSSTLYPRGLPDAVQCEQVTLDSCCYSFNDCFLLLFPLCTRWLQGNATVVSVHTSLSGILLASHVTYSIGFHIIFIFIYNKCKIIHLLCICH